MRSPFSVLFVFCGLAWVCGAAEAVVRVAATTTDLAAIAKEVGGADVDVRALSLSAQDPHFVDPKPSLVVELNRTNLVVLVGAELETGWLPGLLTSARNPEIQPGTLGYFDSSSSIALRDLPTSPIDRSMGDLHSQGNPHYLSDPRAAALVAGGLAARLVQLDPTHASGYRTRLGSFLAALDQARQGWERRLAKYRGAPVLSYHKTWTYLLDWLGLEAVGYLEPKPGVPPSPSHLARLLGLARDRKVKVVLQEDFYPTNTAALVAAKIPATLLRVSAGTRFESGQSYLAHVEELVAGLESALAK